MNWVGTGNATTTHYSEILLVTANNLIESGEPSFATVVIHTACELAVERAISQAFASRKITDLLEPVSDLFQSWNLSNHKVKNLYNVLYSREVQKQPFWDAFTKSAARRNKIVHEGVDATVAEAKDSHAAAVSLLKFLS
jgi:hypothetical protein